MGKKKNKQKGFARIGGSSQAATGGTLKSRDADGFTILGPKANGETAFTEFMRKRTPKKTDIITVPAHMEEVAYADYDPGKILNRLNAAIDMLDKGKFSKAYAELDKTLIEELLDAFYNIDPLLPNVGLINATVTKLLQVCKTFYEYDGKQRAVIPNIEYDRMLAKYRGLGLEEPTGIVPGNKKTSITYPELHNNMDKAYILKQGELIPEGVKESDSVEDFLIRAYTTAGMQTSEDLTVELSPKIDGVSVNGTIMDGCFVKPQTRGDTDASMAIVGLHGLELGPKNSEEFGLQYECFVTDEDRVEAGTYLGLKKPYVSNRHAAAGIISRLCADEDDGLLAFLSFYPIEASGLGKMSYQNRIAFIQDYACVPDDMLKRKTITGNLETLLKKIRETFNKFADKRESLSYSIDGMVITIVDQDVREMLGRKGRTNMYQIGYKFDPANAKAIVKGLSLDYGNKGYRTIQVELEHPVFLDGVRYDHVPVLSASLFEQMGLRNGSEVNVHRVGDVIPSITVIKEGNGRPLSLATRCPSCGEKLIERHKKLYCGNYDCPSNRVGKFLGFFNAIGLDGYGESFIEAIATGKNPAATTFRELFDLDAEKLKGLGIGDALASEFQDRLIKAVAKTPDYTILGAMGWPDIGASRAKELIKAYGSVDQVLSATQFGQMEEQFYKAIGEVGRQAARWLTESETRLNDIRDDLAVLHAYMENITTDFSDKIKVGYTGGDLSEEIENLCVLNNMEIVSGKSFDILITADPDSTSGKMKVAQKKKLPIFTEGEFLKAYRK